MPIPEVTVEELAGRLQQPVAERPALLDVRNPDEHAFVAFPGSVLIPLHELEDRADELEELRGREVIVYCHHGIRSQGGAALLLERGYDAKSLRGGIDLFSVRVDPSVPRY